MKTSNHNLIIVLLELSIFFLLCLAIINSPHVKGQTIPGRESIFNVKRQKVQEIYTSQIGIREKGLNSGLVVEQYLNYVNLPKGNPWCAAFICWVYGQANVDNPRTSWSPDMFKSSKVIWTKAESRKLNVESRVNYNISGKKYQDKIFLGAMSVRPTNNNQQPTTADIFGIYFPAKKRIAHAGFIDQWDGTWLITVEGNTNVSGGREGDGVYRKRRLVKSIYQVARYIPLP